MTEYQIIGADLSGLWLQPGFVEGIVTDRKSFAGLDAAYRHIFRRNLEYAIVLWNGIPVRFSYQEDLPTMVTGLVALLSVVLSAETPSFAGYPFRTPNLDCLWQVETDGDMVTLEGFWQSVSGRYEAALNTLGLIRMQRTAFLCEWKLLLRQFVRAMADADANLTSTMAREQFEALERLEAAIPARGRFYQY